MDITTTVCDIRPIVGQSTKRYTIKIDGEEAAELDLCDEHAEPIAVLIEQVLARKQQPSVNVTQLRPAAKKATAKKTPSDGRRGSRAVKTLAEIEREKA